MHRAVSELPDQELATRIAHLWPHREHEANAALGLLCRAGIHRWRELDLATLVPGRSISFCLWCSSVKLDGTTYEI